MSTTVTVGCTVCNEKICRYTCPGCLARTCSASCISAHKKLSNCSGQRNKAAYVPLNQYTWGTMMNDFTYLEDVQRRVSAWGRDIATKGISKRGRTVRGKGITLPIEKGKRETLRSYFESQDITMHLLPIGMERRKQNQSNIRSQVATLSIEYTFHGQSAEVSMFKLLLHNNNVAEPLTTLLRQKIAQTKGIKFPQWVRELVDDENSPPLFVIEHRDFEDNQHPLFMKQRQYYKIDATAPFIEAIKGKSFVEFPHIEVWEENIFPGVVVIEQSGKLIDLPPQPKKRKPNHKEGKQAMTAVLGDYGSDEEPNAFTTCINDYQSSEEDIALAQEGKPINDLEGFEDYNEDDIELHDKEPTTGDIMVDDVDNSGLSTASDSESLEEDLDWEAARIVLARQLERSAA